MARYTQTRRKYYRKKKTPQYHVFGKGSTLGNVANVAYKGFKLAAKVARMVNVEYHFVQGNVSNNSNYSGQTTNLTTISQGDGETQRTGTSIKLMHLKIRGNITPNGSGAPNQALRFIVYRGKNENGTTPTPSDIINTANTAYACDGFKNWDEMKRSKILYDKRHIISYVNGQQIINKLFSVNLKLYGHTKYTSGSNNIEDGGLYVLVLGDVITNGATYSYTYRLTFTDN